MMPLARNPETGFLESKGSNFTFDSQTKVKFLEMAKAIRANGAWPNITSLCKAVGINNQTFYTHKSIDSAFAEQWSEIVHGAADALESKMYEYAQNKSGYMHMITWLRANQPGKWNPDYKLNISMESRPLNSLIESASIVTEAEIVPNETGLTVKPA